MLRSERSLFYACPRTSEISFSSVEFIVANKEILFWAVLAKIKQSSCHGVGSVVRPSVRLSVYYLVAYFGH